MNVCADEDFLVANGEYAQQYRSLSQQLPKAQHDQLRRTQTAWLNFRTAACRFESGAAAGGSVQHYVYWTCAARMTRERSAELARIGTCREGDITCTAKKP